MSTENVQNVTEPSRSNRVPRRSTRGRSRRRSLAVLLVAFALLGTTVQPAVADGSYWWGVPVPEAKLWTSVSYGNGVWIAVNANGSGSGAMRSADGGATWTAVSTPGTFSEWYSVAYGNGVWVAVAGYSGSSYVMRSTDGGVTWTEVAAAANNDWRSVAYGNGVWVAVSIDGTNRVMRSTDGGLTWTAVAAAESNQWLSVAYGNGVWVAVAASGTNRVMRSVNDGVTWSAVAAAELNPWQSVAYGNGVWIAVAAVSGTNRVMRSTDGGATWSAVAAAEQNNWFSVAYGDGVWVAVSGDGTNRVMRSIDGGLNWSAVLAAEQNLWRSVAFGGDTWFAVSINGTNRVMRSPFEPQLQACSFTPSELTVSESSPSAQTVMTYSGLRDVSLQIYTWLVTTVDGVADEGGNSPIFTDLFPSPWTRTYTWSAERDGTVRTVSYAPVAFGGGPAGEPLCSITIRYGSTGGAKNYGKSDKTASPGDRNRESFSPTPPPRNVR